MDLAAAKAFLQRREGSSSVYEHLTEVILKLVSEQPEHALEAFEAISSRVKAASFPAAAPGEGRPAGGAADEATTAARGEHIKASAALFAPVPEAVAPEAVQDLPGEAALLEWAGVGLGRTELYRLHLSLKQLSAKQAVEGKAVSQLRFWGRVHGVRADYLVAEGVLDGGAEGETEEDKDAGGRPIEMTGQPGANRYTYWVSTHGVTGPWTQLPRVEPSQLLVARAQRRLLTGSLDAPVGGHPPFPGNEASLLRARIGLISAATVLAPAGVFEADDAAEGAVRRAEGGEVTAPREVGGWAHLVLEINANGRTRDPPAEDGTPSEPPAVLRGADSAPSVDPDAEARGDSAAAWEVRGFPVKGLPEGEADGGGPVALVSQQWPGAVAAAEKGRFVNAYVGWGVPMSPKPYRPQLPAALPSEYTVLAEGEDAESKAVKEAEDVREPPPVEKDEATD